MRSSQTSQYPIKGLTSFHATASAQRQRGPRQENISNQKRSSPDAEKRRHVPKDRHPRAGLPHEGRPVWRGRKRVPHGSLQVCGLLRAQRRPSLRTSLGARLPCGQARASRSLGPLPPHSAPNPAPWPSGGISRGDHTSGQGAPRKQRPPFHCPLSTGTYKGAW